MAAEAPHDIARRLHQHALVDTDGDKGEAGIEIALRVVLVGRPDAAGLAGRLEQPEPLYASRLGLRVAACAKMAAVGRMVDRADKTTQPARKHGERGTGWE